LKFYHQYLDIGSSAFHIASLVNDFVQFGTQIVCISATAELLHRSQLNVGFKYVFTFNGDEVSASMLYRRIQQLDHLVVVSGSASALGRDFMVLHR
jgi:hypothetical protein